MSDLADNIDTPGISKHLTPAIKPPAFTHGQLTFRPLSEEDLEDTLQWRMCFKQFFNDASEIILENHKKWFNQYRSKNDDYIFIVINEKNNKVGQVAIYNIDRIHKNAEFGRFLANPAFVGMGYMKQACTALINYAKFDLQLDELYLEVKSHNEKARYIYEINGFEIKDNKNDNVVMKLNIKEQT